MYGERFAVWPKRPDPSYERSPIRFGITDTMTMYAVLTGDLVRSTSLSPADLAVARDILSDAANEIGGWKPGLAPAHPEFFRGDSWQFLLEGPKFSLRAAIFIRGYLLAHGFDTRLAVGLGSVRKIDRQRVSLSVGEAFLLSGKALDKIPSATKIHYAMPAELNPAAGGLVPLSHVCSAIVDSWSSRQAKIVCDALHPNAVRQAELAERFGVSQQSVSKTLASAELSPLMTAVNWCEGLPWDRLPSFRVI